MKVLDTHLGSGTIAVASHGAKVDLYACEVSKSYFDKAHNMILSNIPASKVKILESGKMRPTLRRN